MQQNGGGAAGGESAASEGKDHDGPGPCGAAPEGKDAGEGNRSDDAADSEKPEEDVDHYRLASVLRDQHSFPERFDRVTEAHWYGAGNATIQTTYAVSYLCRMRGDVQAVGSKAVFVTNYSEVSATPPPKQTKAANPSAATMSSLTPSTTAPPPCEAAAAEASAATLGVQLLMYRADMRNPKNGLSGGLGQFTTLEA